MKFVRVLLLCLVYRLDKDSSSLLVHASNCTSITMSNSELAISRQICLCSSTFSREKLLLQYPLLLTFKLHPQPFARNDSTFWRSLTSHSLHCILESNSILVSGSSATNSSSSLSESLESICSHSLVKYVCSADCKLPGNVSGRFDVFRV